MKRFVFIALGGITFGLGTLGIFVPFLPTAVFYLVTAFFWLRSSERLHTRFIESASYKKYVQEPIIEKKISPPNRMKMFGVLFIIFLIPCLLVDNLAMRVTMAAVYLAHVIGLSWYLKRPKKGLDATVQVTKMAEVEK